MPYLQTTYPRIAIIGAGIGGLTTALQLHASGFTNIDIFESADKLTTLGVGINVQPHAILVLRNLGLLPALEATGILTKELNYYNKHGDDIISEPRGRDAGYRIPQLSIHRGEFQMLLLDTVKERLGEERIHLNHTFTSFDQDEQVGRVTAHFTARGNQPLEHASYTADLLVAADGINSIARRILYPNEGPPRFSGRILWRGCVERAPYLTGASMVWGGHANQKFIAYPISGRSQRAGRSLVNWICELRVREENDPDMTPPKTDWTATVPKERFAPPFDKWQMGGLGVKDLIDQTDKVFEFPMCDRDPVDRWSFGHITLLGDAAHAMYPIGSNGASQAILDAEALVQALVASIQNPDSYRTIYDIPAALKAYETERLPPTSRIVMANRGNGPDQVMQVAEERAPEGFKNVHDIIPKEELEDIGRVYKSVAGFEIEKVNQRAQETEGEAERLGLTSPQNWLSGKQGIIKPVGVISVL